MTIPTIWIWFPETNQKSLEDIDLLFGERALGALPENLEKHDADDAIQRENVAKEHGVGINQVELGVNPGQTK